MRNVWTRRRFMCALGFGALSFISPKTLQSSEKKNERPNVLFIALDVSLPKIPSLFIHKGLRTIANSRKTT